MEVFILLHRSRMGTILPALQFGGEIRAFITAEQGVEDRLGSRSGLYHRPVSSNGLLFIG